MQYGTTLLYQIDWDFLFKYSRRYYGYSTLNGKNIYIHCTVMNMIFFI